MEIKGRINSFQSLGAVDGPRVRFVVFFKGCPLTCLCCHNPETRPFEGGEEYTASQIVEKALRYREYFGEKGGITLSGGEPIAQPKFAAEILKLCKENGLHTCIDTSGYTLNDDVKELLKYTDLVLLDIKHINSNKHNVLTGHKNENILEFAKYLNKKQVPMWVRYVLVPGFTDDLEDVKNLKNFLNTLKNIEKIEVLPYHTMGEKKYEELKIDYKLKGVKPPEKELVSHVNKILKGDGK